MNGSTIPRIQIALLSVFLLLFAVSTKPLRVELQIPLDPRYSQDFQTAEVESRNEWKLRDEGGSPLGLRTKLHNSRDERLQFRGGCYIETGEVIVGVNVAGLRSQELEDLISSGGGRVIDRIFVDERVRALAVEIPINSFNPLAEKLRANELVEYVEPNSKVEVFFTPNDPYWSYQWGPEKIEADVAWNVTTGSSGPLVAIIDTGIDYTHSDLAANYAPLGYDWVNNDTDPMDDHGHGTHCAGIVAAELNNSVGIAGLAQVQMLAEKTFNSTGYGTDFLVAQGIYHAVAAGAKIISMSFGSYTYSQTEHDAVKYAYNHGVLMVAAAGNAGSEVKGYPAAYDEVVAVSATDQDDNLATFSNYGSWISLGAPGVDIYSTLPGNSYDYKYGTSMACPHVTGIAALAWAAFANLTRDQIWLLLEISAEDLGDEGFDPYYGYGRVNARRAVIGLPEHDLCITSWQHRSRLDPGQQGTFNATVSNYGGNNETNVSVQFFVNETIVDSLNIDFLETTASQPMSFSWNTTTIGVYNVTCYVVPVPGESLSENNAASSNVTVRFPATLRVPDDYPTIKAAIDNALDGDAVLVSEGYYAEGQIDIFTDCIALVADGHVILDGRLESYTLNVEANDVTIEGFDIQNGSSYGVNMKGDGNILTQNTIRTQQGVRVHNSRDSLISRNTLQDIGNGRGLYVVEADNVTVRYNNIKNFASDGITLYYCSNSKISGNNITSNEDGIWLYHSSNNSISGNNITSNEDGIWFWHSSSNSILGNNVANNEDGILLDHSSNNSISGNNITANYEEGIWLYHSSNNSISGNMFTDDGLRVSGSYQNSVENNTVNGRPLIYLEGVSNYTVDDAGQVILVRCDNITIEGLHLSRTIVGIELWETGNSTISGNNITANGWGIWLYLSSSNSILGNNVANNEDGIHLYHSSNNSISGNNITDTRDDAVLIDEGFSIIVSENLIKNNLVGIYLIFVHNSTVHGNNVTENYYGINTNFSPNNTISSNLIAENEVYGILLEDDPVGSNSILGNSILKNSIGVYLSLSPNNTLRLNSMVGNGLNFGVSYTPGFALQDIDTSNTVDGKPIYYLINRRDELVPSDAGYVALLNCTNMTAENLELRNNLQGLLLVNTHNSTIQNNNITSNGHGIDLTSSFNNTIHNNNIENNDRGIYLFGSSSNTFSQNNLANNLSGIRIKDSVDNFIYHNSFANNISQVLLFGASHNTWADGYPSGGNYWDDYGGVDVNYGPYQNETGSDGIGDTPYVVNAYNQDDYPLMKPYPWGSHDIGITAVVASKTIVGHGYPLHINIAVFNYGMFTENFNVTALANMTILGAAANVTLTSRVSTLLTFVWSTTDFAKGNYTISAQASPVQNETDTGDNTFSDAWVFVTIPGDADADRDVDIYDITMIADAYDSKEGDERYVAVCDWDGDGDIDIYDIVIAAGNYDKSW